LYLNANPEQIATDFGMSTDKKSAILKQLCVVGKVNKLPVLKAG